MCQSDVLQKIREAEKESHIETYSKLELFQKGTWLEKPIKTVLELLPRLESRKSIRVLDLGSGVGRNSIPIAQYLKDKDCQICCVDILDMAIEKLNAYAKEYSVGHLIEGRVSSIESFRIPPQKYDLILAVSALEHVCDKKAFRQKLAEIRDGVREYGYVCLVMNTEVTEKDYVTGQILEPQFEVNLSVEELQTILKDIFQEWETNKCVTCRQQYEVPRNGRYAVISTNVVSWVVQNKSHSSE